ncbi:hypothetical protein N5079_19690 [Planotetraspora sp. A-T 1434]|uniref:hypothetical protein n=1 Tax=Planotetraspora sp. A-T 1434 TaxID=2979219 RepID=UPI0021BF97D4|nr:hypothetical protein [Planotetraspora sp. A-T 1434]MCT9932427.1 hypothetical protein [Planotetraspora sp. A-T 1434]
MTEPRRFQLHRDQDISGVSGTGIVADGVLWPDGTADLRWRGPRPSAVHWDRLDDAEAIHGHNGATRFVWLDTASAPDAERKYTPRGFRIYAEVTDRYGSRVSVQESSLATEDCVWIFAKNDRDENPSPHLTVDNARVIRDALAEFLREWNEAESGAPSQEEPTP